MRTLVVSDSHGRHRHVRRLLAGAGVLDDEGRRIRDYDVRVVHIGDLINGTKVTREQDEAILHRAVSWFDVLILGNHEYGYLGGYGFKGFVRYAEVERLIRDLVWRPAVAVGETLLTHAGVADALGVRSRDASSAAVEIGEAWLADPGHPFFAACGSGPRGGKQLVGGILWRDASEPRSVAFSQVHGHTPNPSGPTFVGDPGGVFCGNIDVGAREGRVAAVWLDDAGRLAGDVLVAEFQE